jgi:ABC-type branched-subunit amino acid transport system substrate-binding protein
VRAVRAAGWTAAIYTGPSGEDPLVRQRLADRPEWVDGLTFVSFRITSEQGPEPFTAYRKAFEAKYGEERIGVGDVVMPPDWSMFSYDAVKLVAAALPAAGGPGPALLDALENTVITGANGDERGYSPTDREGVVPDDMYFGRFDDLRFAPVHDDLLSDHLPVVEQ